jgi:hypothetical protein
MAEVQVANPVVPGTSPAAEKTEQDSSILTGKTQAAEGTTPSAEGAASETPKWMAQLPEDLKSSKSLTRYPTIGDLGKAYVDLEGKLGSAVTLPGPQATDEERARYRKAIGVPDKPTDYKIERVKLPGGLFEGMDDRFLALAHTMGMTPDQAKLFHAFYNKEIVTTLKDKLTLVKSTIQETETAMRTKHGATYETVATNWDRGLRAYFSEHAIQLFARSGLGNDQDILEGFAKIGATVVEHKFVDGKPAGAGAPKPLEELMYGPEKK